MTRGWHPSPAEFSVTGRPSGLFRWHDGHAWTAHVAAHAGARAPGPERPVVGVAVPDPVTAPLDLLPHTVALRL